MSKHVFPIFIWFIDHQFLLSMIYLRFIGDSCESHMGGKYIQYSYLMGRKRNDTFKKKKTFTAVFMMMVRKTRVRYKWLRITLNLFHEKEANGRFEARKKVRNMKSIFWNEWREKWFIWKIYTKSYENLNRKVFRSFILRLRGIKESEHSPFIAFYDRVKICHSLISNAFYDFYFYIVQLSTWMEINGSFVVIWSEFLKRFLRI